MSALGNQNLLFGVLALRLDLITQDQLVEAVKAWAVHRERSLGEFLIQQGALTATAPELLDPIVEYHLARHGGDAARSLAALSTVAPVQQALLAIGDMGMPTSANIPETLTDPDATAARPGDRPVQDTVRLPDMRGSDGSPLPHGETRYQIERHHARGGLGEVFVALDVELNRKVALKQIREQHADDPVSRSQFLVEGEITGGLEHPGIIPIYGLGHYANGRPYYAMRFVKGDTLLVAIERFHDAGQSMSTSERNLAFRELLRRFLDVCQAIAYAHQRGVLHRDLKPGNVLLGGFGETLVIDWGLAKLLGKSSAGPPVGVDIQQAETSAQGPLQPVTTSHEPLETVGRGAHGTPGYMSPEQVSGDIDALGPATDIYSLGAILYHLLTNRPPLTQKDGDILARTVRGDFLTARQVKPDAPAGLDAVCRKAMALRPGDRYAAVQQLREDVNQWLADEPVSAWREPLGVKARRWIRKHPRQVAALTAIVLMTMVGVGVGTLLLGEKNRALTLALSGERAERQRADDRTRLANERFTIALDAFKQQVFDADRLFVNRPGVQDLRKAMLTQALDGLQKLIKEAEKTEGADRVRAWAHFALGDVSLSLDGQVEKALQEYQKAFELCQRLADPKDSQSQRDLSISHDKLGHVLARLGEVQKSLDHYQESMRIAKALADADPKNRERQRDLAIAYDQIGDMLYRQGELEKSLEQYQESMAIHKRLAQPEDLRSQRDLSIAFGQIGDVFLRQGQLEKALEQYEASMTIRARIADPKNAQSQRDLSNARTRIGDVLLQQGQLEKALEQYRKSMTICKRLADADPSNAAAQRSLSIAYDKLGDVLLRQEEFEKALEPYQESMHIARRLADADPRDSQAQRDLALAYDQLGRVRFRLLQWQEALEQYQEALTVFKRLADADGKDRQSQHDLALAYGRVGDTLLTQGERRKAAEHFQEGLTISKRLARATDAEAQRSLSIAHDKLGLVWLDQGELGKAMEQYEASMNIAKRLADAAPMDAMLQRDLAIAYDQIGNVLMKQEQVKKALEQYAEGYRIRKSVADLDPSNVAAQWGAYLSLDLLGKISSSSGDPARAAEWYEKAVALLQPLDKKGKLKGSRYAGSLGRAEAKLRDCRTAEKALGPLDMLLKLPDAEAVKLLLVRADWLTRQGKHADAATAADKLAALARDGASAFAAASAYAWCVRDKANEDRHAARCVELLRKARDGGYFKDAEQVKELKGEAFRPLLGREDFKKLLAELEMKRD